MEHWVVDDVQDSGKWLLFDENGTDSNIFIRVSGSKTLAVRVAAGLNTAPAEEFSVGLTS